MMGKQVRIGEIPGAGMDFQPKERKRRTMEEQIIFNTERLAVLHKELSELRAMLESYSIIEPQESPLVSHNTLGHGEINSQMMQKLLYETSMINELIAGVAELKRNLQL